MSYRSTILNDAPVGYWRLNDSTSSALDHSGNNNTGTSTAVTTGQVSAFATDSTSASSSFNGTTSTIAIPTAAALHPGDTFSIEAWFKTSTAQPQRILDGGGSTDFALYLDNVGHIVMSKGGVQSVGQTTTTYLDNAWHYIVWTKATTTNHLYVDSVDVTPAIVNRTITTSGANLTIGSTLAGGAAFFLGNLQEVALYSVALNPFQVLNHYQVATQNQAGLAVISGDGLAGIKASLTGPDFQGRYVLDVSKSLPLPNATGLVVRVNGEAAWVGPL